MNGRVFSTSCCCGGHDGLVSTASRRSKAAPFAPHARTHNQLQVTGRPGEKPFVERLEKHSLFSQISPFQLAQPANSTDLLRTSARASSLSRTLRRCC